MTQEMPSRLTIAISPLADMERKRKNTATPEIDMVADTMTATAENSCFFSDGSVMGRLMTSYLSSSLAGRTESGVSPSAGSFRRCVISSDDTRGQIFCDVNCRLL